MIDSQDLADMYVVAHLEMEAWPTPALGRIVAQLRPAVEAGVAGQRSETVLQAAVNVLGERKPRLVGAA